MHWTNKCTNRKCNLLHPNMNVNCLLSKDETFRWIESNRAGIFDYTAKAESISCNFDTEKHLVIFLKTQSSRWGSCYWLAGTKARLAGRRRRMHATRTLARLPTPLWHGVGRFIPMFIFVVKVSELWAFGVFRCIPPGITKADSTVKLYE